VTPLDGEEKILYNFLKDKDKVLLDTIAVGCAMPTYKVAQLLLKLEMKSLVRPLPGKLFQWI
jgi:DNA processing protein